MKVSKRQNDFKVTNNIFEKIRWKSIFASSNQKASSNLFYQLCEQEVANGVAL